MESRTGCDTWLSSPGKVGYLRTFTHRDRKLESTGGPHAASNRSDFPHCQSAVQKSSECVAFPSTSAGSHQSSLSSLASVSCLDALKDTI